MESIDQPEQNHQNRTVTLHLGNTLAEYEAMILTESGIQTLIQRVEIADSLNWGPLANGHHPGCPRLLYFTHHDSYAREAKHFDGRQSVITLFRVRYLDCGAVFTIQPSFIVRYKRYDTNALKKFMVLLFITEDSYRMAGISQALGIDTQQAGTWAALEEAASGAISPTALWALVQWLG
jgi:hypothetical protein